MSVDYLLLGKTMALSTRLVKNSNDKMTDLPIIFISQLVVLVCKHTACFFVRDYDNLGQKMPMLRSHKNTYDVLVKVA